VTVQSPYFDYLYIDDLKLLVQENGAWVLSSSIPLDRTVRLAVLYHADEAAGRWYPPCVTGAVRIVQDGRPGFSGTLRCASTSGAPFNGAPYAYVDASLGAGIIPGTVDVGVSIEYSGSGDTKTFHESVVSTLSPREQQRPASAFIVL
jgi:hypothetical protein